MNPLMWIGLGLFVVTGGLIGWVVEHLLCDTTGWFRTLLLGATILATPVAVVGSLVGGCSALRASRECDIAPRHHSVTRLSHLPLDHLVRSEFCGLVAALSH